MARYAILILTLLATTSLFANDTEFTLMALDNNTLKLSMESNLGMLMKEINHAYNEKRQPKLKSVKITDSASESIMMLWENSPFHCIEEEITEDVLIASTQGDYEIRNIPLLFENLDDDDRYHEVAISFNSTGTITSFRLVIGQNLYQQVIKQGGAVSDVHRRQVILDYVEQFRTSYDTKDINFLNQVFSDDALIITGRVVMPKKSDMNINPTPKIEYSKQDKKTYLTKLSKIFKYNKRIHVTFDKIKVLRHPTDTNWYGVTLHQGYTSDTYHDDGWLFLLWDFSIEDAPVIHVRTWQPDTNPFTGKQLDEDEIFGMDDCNIM